VGMSEEKRIFGRPRCKWEDDIKWNLTEIRLESVEWINMARDMDK